MFTSDTVCSNFQLTSLCKRRLPSRIDEYEFQGEGHLLYLLLAGGWELQVATSS